ncbi:MAG: hypothetical protein HS100_18820 [Anaerolineales bacterium]|nr:hypothetical protein [Anaerolineales bacterium]
MNISIDNPIALLIICLLPLILIFGIGTGIKKRIELIKELTSNAGKENSPLKWMPMLMLVLMIAGVIFIFGWLCLAVYWNEIVISKAGIIIFIGIIFTLIILGELYIKSFTQK